MWFFLATVLSLIIFMLLKAFTGLPVLSVIIISLAGAMWFTSELVGRPSGIRFVVNGMVLFILVFLSYQLAVWLLNNLSGYDPEDKTFKPEETVELTTMIENRDTIAIYASNRHWKDNYGNDYSGKLAVRQSDFLDLRDYLNSYKNSSRPNFWGRLYDHIEQKDAPSLDLLMNVFTNIHHQHQLSQMEFAEMVVSCIQDIPYSLVFQEDCLPPENYEESIKSVLIRCPDCCIGNIAFGIQNPVSFISNLKGDCDTRTVLIYSILKHFNYDVAILNSDFYRHSVIGLHLPSSGLQKSYKGKRYYLWETTAKYYEIGQLPASFDNVSHWNVVLTSK